jgi:anti-anti-sigma regulatory factor
MQYLANPSATTFSYPISTLATSRPRTVVLRPNGCLDEASSPAFTKAIEQALDLTTETVIVDLLWVDSVQPEGIACLIAGLKLASTLGKTLSLRFMDVPTQAYIKAAYER